MKIFVFDTETTGFIDKAQKDLDKQPHIIQFAGIMGNLNENGNFIEEKRIDILINPKIPIPYSSSEIHHIYDIDVKNAPYIEEVIDKMLNFINGVDVIVGHNIEYDEDMIKLELKRLGREHEYHPKQVICTMNQSINFCKLPKKNKESNGYKRPKLGELHKVLFGEYFIGAHDAMTDVEATLRCFVELYKKRVIKIEDRKDELITLF